MKDPKPYSEGVEKSLGSLLFVCFVLFLNLCQARVQKGFLQATMCCGNADDDSDGGDGSGS